MTHLKFTDPEGTQLEGLLLPYGGPFNNADLSGERFTKSTDFCLQWFQSDRPLLWHHGLDSGAGVVPVGRIKSIELRDDGGWMQAQLDTHNQYYAAIRDLVKQGKVGLSSGAMAHLVEVDKPSGEIRRWPVVEGSITPSPCNPYAHVSFADAAKHYKAIGIDPTTALKAMAEGTDAGGGYAVGEPLTGAQGDYPCAACKTGVVGDCTCPGCTSGAACVCCTPSADGDDDDAMKTWPDEWYLHMSGSKGYGRYRDATGTVDAGLLQHAMNEVERAGLPDQVRQRIIAQAKSIALDNGLQTATRSSARKSGGTVYSTAEHTVRTAPGSDPRDRAGEDLLAALRMLTLKAIRSGLEYVFDGHDALIEQAMVIGAQHDDVLDHIRAAVFPGHDVAHIVSRFLPPADGAAIQELVANNTPKGVRTAVDAPGWAASHHNPAVPSVAASIRAQLGIGLNARVVAELLPADLANGDHTSPAFVRRMGTLKSKLARIAAEHSSGQLMRPLSDNGLTALAARLRAHSDTSYVDNNFSMPLKATWTQAFIDSLPDSCFLYVEPDGARDSAGKTTPRSKRHFPYKDKDGKVDLPHLRNALARIPQSALPDDIKQAVAAKARRIAKANGIEAEAAKAMADVLDILAHGDAEAAEGDYEGCYEDLIQDLTTLLNPANPWAQGGFTSLLRTYPTYCICCRYDGDEQTFWRIPYSIDAVGEPVLGEPLQVEQTYVPAKAFLDAGPLALDAHATAQRAAALERRTQDLFERRTKDGRVFSTANVKELTASAEQSIAAGRKILALIESSVRREQEAAKAAALAAPDARERRLKLLELGAD